MTSIDPLLAISDGTTTISLLDPNGILLYDWIPALAEPKGGGDWADSPLVEGRKLAYRQFGNTTDTFELKVRGHSQDDAIFRLQELRRLLEKAVAYWLSDAQNAPVYLMVRAAYETNTRYAVIYDYRTPRDANPFKQPFFGCRALVDEFLLAVEHSAWQDNIPGQGTCVEVSGEQVYTGTPVTLADYPTDGSDDCYCYLSLITDAYTIDLTSTELIIGRSGNNEYEIGIRFTAVNIPTGATILNAWVDLVSVSNNFTPVNTRIYGNDVDDAATFSTSGNFTGRVLTSASAEWTIPAAPFGTVHSTPDLAAVIQEIVNRAGWAANNDIAILFKNNGFASGKNNRFVSTEGSGGGLDKPVLNVIYSTTASATYGQEATCAQGVVFIANKNNTAALTHIYKYDATGAVFTSLLGTALPYYMLPMPWDTGDYAYFGSTVGPFNNLVFDLLIAINGGTSTWEYSTGAGTWATLTVEDNTLTTRSLDTDGVHSIHWVQPSAWVAAAVNGVTAFWVRLVPVGAAIRAPQQQNRQPYTCIWPYVDLESDQVSGDIPALAQIKVTNQSDDDGASSPTLHTNRLIIGARSLSRGDDFTAYLNVSDEQNNADLTVTLGANTAYSNVGNTITGRLATYTSPASAAETTEVTFTLGSVIGPQYYGRFRAFLRYKYNTGSADATALRLVTTPGGSGMAQISDYFYPQNNTDQQIADLGIVNIQPRSTADEYSTITFAIKVTPDGSAGEVLYFYDLVLIPVDEWATDAVDESGNTTLRNGAIGAGDLLDVDSVTYPRKVDQAVLRDASNGRIIGYFQNRQPGPAVLQANAAQRLWFLAIMYESGTELSSPISISHTVQVYRAARYLSARGKR